jgi:hypothetical protein
MPNAAAPRTSTVARANDPNIFFPLERRLSPNLIGIPGNNSGLVVFRRQAFRAAWDARTITRQAGRPAAPRNDDNEYCHQ